MPQFRGILYILLTHSLIERICIAVYNKVMSYWTKYIFNDKKFWFKLLIPGIGFLIIIDLFSYLYNPPGYFNLWSLKLFIIIGIPVIVKLIHKNFSTLKKIKKVEKEAPVFEKNREKEILDIIKSDPEFTTFCYECIYFNEETSSCKRDRVFERVKEINVGNRKYCLYWEKNSNSNKSELI